RLRRGRARNGVGLGQLAQALARAADGEALFVQQAADAADHLHVVVLVVAAVAPALDRLELRELLLPVAQHVRLDRAQLADLANREVSLGGDRRQLGLRGSRIRHGSRLRPWPSTSGWRGR